MPRYEVVLFDADHTLFDFDRAEREASARRWRGRDAPPTGRPRRATYPSTGRSGTGLDRGEVLPGVAGGRAVCRPAAGPGPDGRCRGPQPGLPGPPGGGLLPPAGGSGAVPRPGPRCTLAIVTNGVARAQRRRFEASPLNGLIPWLFISEELGPASQTPPFLPRCSVHWGIQTPAGC